MSETRHVRCQGGLTAAEVVTEGTEEPAGGPAVVTETGAQARGGRAIQSGDSCREPAVETESSPRLVWRRACVQGSVMATDDYVKRKTTTYRFDIFCRFDSLFFVFGGQTK